MTTGSDSFEYDVVSAQSDVLAQKACAYIAEQLTSAIALRGMASLMVSGGSSPKPLFANLAKADIAWDRVTVSLVDERWVNPGQPGSNETFIKENFLTGAAGRAKFISLKTPHASAAEGLVEVEQRFAAIPAPFDICVMGMGLDSHTASWFPGAEGRAAAMDEHALARFAQVDARGCAGAGDFPERISLTLSAVMDSRSIVMFIPGGEKRRVFEAADAGDVARAPVAALKSAGKRLVVFTGLS